MLKRADESCVVCAQGGLLMRSKIFLWLELCIGNHNIFISYFRRYEMNRSAIKKNAIPVFSPFILAFKKYWVIEYIIQDIFSGSCRASSKAPSPTAGELFGSRQSAYLDTLKATDMSHVPFFCRLPSGGECGEKGQHPIHSPTNFTKMVVDYCTPVYQRAHIYRSASCSTEKK